MLAFKYLVWGECTLWADSSCAQRRSEQQRGVEFVSRAAPCSARCEHQLTKRRQLCWSHALERTEQFIESRAAPRSVAGTYYSQRVPSLSYRTLPEYSLLKTDYINWCIVCGGGRFSIERETDHPKEACRADRSRSHFKRHRLEGALLSCDSHLIRKTASPFLLTDFSLQLKLIYSFHYISLFFFNIVAIQKSTE